MASTHSFISFILCLLLLNNVIAHPHHHSDHHAHLFAHKRHPTCRAETSPYDYSAKVRKDMETPVCEVTDNPIKDIVARNALVARDDYTCSQSKPCSNGACCSKKTGYCNYGPDACGPNLGSNPSPNDVCWSNCNAVAECGRYALPANKTCPLNVCCSEFGFCGTTPDFCSLTGTNGGCQSNCPQPGSGGSGGNVQSRVIGYYEAWAHNRDCQSMDFNNIPAGALTHLYFSFGYITPGDFNVAPMDDLAESLFSSLTAVKARNPDLKAVVALGGWTFNDNNTATQPVFSNMVSSSANRQKFIGNLLSFMRKFAFDGVDFDWEYPGAPDRGGKPDDGKNFVIFLKELKAAIASQPIQYVVSFTVPTSYWYLRWFDLSAVNYVDWINVMSYDLHGTWDSTNPIGNHVLAHTNLTEIKLALDLFWRNNVPPGKLNLGVGFYGRSFQLSDPSCNTPGCLFKGGASPGPCTKNSGTLSYREITSIIDQQKIQPIHDKVNAVKYITWNQDQWVSYDDGDTFKQKVDFANNLGLGGLLIWSIDQDTDDLRALSALLAPKDLSAFKKQADNAAFWQDSTSADCYVTDCGGTCKAGFLQVTHQPCGGAKAITRHSKEADSALCCPITAAPDPNKCTWRGTAPSCNGHCHDNEVALQLNRWGDGKYCEDGNKVYCCQTERPNKCYFSGVGKDCNSGDQTLTFAGTFLETIVDIIDIFPPTLFGSALDDALSHIDMDLRKKLCCPPDEMKRWKNCAWHGQPGSCFDNHCDTGHQVQVANSKYGQGLSCFPRLERERVFCCDATDGASPFSPVSLAYLFPHPPTGSSVDIDTKLKVDNTWGDGVPDTADDLPNDSTFGFVVLASPQELQVSLDKRDGSDWVVFNCNDATSEEEQTVQMYCSNADTSDCDKLFLGHGAPGTIIEMPEGCGPSRYAVLKSLVPSEKQVFPKHLEKRSYAHGPTIHDLTFDYRWDRVPRDLGDTQMRIDYSNEVGYWNSIVNKAGNTKRKRSLEEMGGNHKRWLEEEWRDDMHFGGLSREELHKRWFGKDVIDWLKGFFNPDIKPQYNHHLSNSFTAKLIEEHFNCKIKGVDVDAHLLIQALLNIDVRTSFGITIIATLGRPISFSSSYLYFKNQGEVSAIFTLDALAKATFGRDLELFNLGNFPGATFGIPKLVTVGPNFRLLGRVDAQISLAGHLESRARIAAWDVQMTYPAASDDYKPKNNAPLTVDGTGDVQGISKPTFDYSVTATGTMSAHLKPTFEFGIHFDDMWGVPSATVQLIADGSVTVYAEANYGNTGQCPFTYGIDVGARLYTHVDAPNFGWNIPDFDLFPLVTRSPVRAGTCASTSKRSIEAGDHHEDHEYQPYNASAWRDASRDVSTYAMDDVSPALLGSVSHLNKRAGVYGPPFQLPKTGCYFCPGQTSGGQSTDCTKVTGWEDQQLAQSVANDWLLKRDDDSEIITIDIPGNHSENPHYNFFEKRQSKDIEFCSGMHIVSPAFDSSGTIVGRVPNIPTYGYVNPDMCNDFDFRALGATPADTSKFATEHILEFQLIKIFLEEYSGFQGNNYPDPLGTGRRVNLCTYLKQYWYNIPVANFPTINGVTLRPIQFVAAAFPGTDNNNNEFVLLESGVNCAKEGMWGRSAINSDNTMKTYEQQDPEKEIRNLKDVLTAYRYHTIDAIRNLLLTQRNRVGTAFQAVENALNGQTFVVRGTTVLPYQTQNLQAQWLLWSSARLDVARTKAETYMNVYLANLQRGYANDYLRDAATKANAAGDPAPSIRIEKIDRLAAAIAARPAWNPPF